MLVKRWLFPLAAKYAAEKVQEKFQERMGSFGAQAQQPQRPEGEVHIDYQHSQSNKNRTRPDEGEYVDYEEIR